MPKRNRVRARARRPIESAQRIADVDRGERTPRQRSRSALAGPVKATDEASPILQRAAAAEKAYVMKDVRRLGTVVAVMLALLVASGFAVSSLPQ